MADITFKIENLKDFNKNLKRRLKKMKQKNECSKLSTK